MNAKDITTFRLDSMEKKQDSVIDELKSLRQEIKEEFQNLENRFASKMSEKIVYGLVALVLTGAGAAMLSLIYK